MKTPAGAWPSPTKAKARTKVGCDPRQVRKVLFRLLGQNGDEVRKGTPAAFPEVAHAIRRRFGDEVRSILDLMSKVDGPTWWQENGVELYNAVFDLSAGSRSLQVLNDYFLAPKRGGTPLFLKNPT